MYRHKKTWVFTLLILSFSLLIFISENILLTEDHYYEFYGNQLSLERIESMIKLREKWSWMAYPLLPIIYLLKFSILSTWILIGVIFFGYRASFKQIFQMVIVSEFVFLIPSFIKVIWFGLIDMDYTLTDLSYFTPLSLANFFDLPSIDPWWVYPLQSINVFEGIYVVVLAVGIKQVLKRNYRESLKFTLPVYGSGLLTWIIFITFLTLNFSS